MPNGTIELQALVKKSPGANFLREMIVFAAASLMELECVA
jgi:hypothetical protein